MVVRSHTQLPPWRTGLGAVIGILAGIVWFVLVSQALLNLLPPHQLTLARAEKSAVLAVLLMASAAVALRDWSVFWQVALQSTAAGGLVAGVRLLVVSLFYNWHALFGDVGLVGIMSLILALTSAALMRHWQSTSKGHARASHMVPVPTKSNPGTLAAVIEEIKAGSFLTNARHRSSRRKSAWNMLLPIVIVPLWLLLWWTAVEIVWLVHVSTIHTHIAGAAESWMKGMGSAMSLAGFLVIFPLLIPTMIGAMVLGNFLIYLIPAARAAMDAEDRAFPGTEYRTAQKSLIRIFKLCAPVALALSLVGVWLFD
jgi:hypothetical protein